MSSLKLYYSPNSTSNATEAILDELESALSTTLAERIPITLSSHENQPAGNKARDFLALNPNGLVPVLVHEGVSIWESAAIAMYLGETFGSDKWKEKGALYPHAGPKRGEAMKWIVWTNVQFAAAGMKLGHAMRAAGTAKASGEEVDKGLERDMEKARGDIGRLLGVLDGALEGREFLLGEEYCLADTHLWSFCTYLSMLEVKVDDFGNVKAWRERVDQRPALAKHTGGH